MFRIEDRYDKKRGCGWRKPGGLYLVSGKLAAGCGRLPIPLDVCPTCSRGIKPSRGWTWINATALIADRVCTLPEGDCRGCILADDPGRMGLLWIGGRFYATPEAFTSEVIAQGISRRICAIPREFELGKTWVMIAHREAIENADGSHTPAVFHVFKPERIEYVVADDDEDDKLQRLADRGVTLVRVHRDEYVETGIFDNARLCERTVTR